MNTDISMNTATSFSVKVSRGEEKRRFNFSGKSFQELKAVIAELYSLPVDDFILQYEDDEKDRVTLSSDAEFMEAIKLYKYVLRFFVVNKNPTAATTHQQVPYPFPPHYHRGGRHHGPHGPHDMFPMHMPPPPALTPEGEVAPVSPPHHHHHHRGGRHHGPHGPLGGYSPYGFGPYGHHGHKRCKEEKERCREEKERIKEERKMMKCEKKRFKKQRKCESSSSSSSSSEDNSAQKVQKHEMKQLMRETKQQIKKNWQATKAANPAQWPENRKLMIAEIKAAKRMIAESLNTPAGLVPVEQNVTPAPSPSPVTEMQA